MVNDEKFYQDVSSKTKNNPVVSGGAVAEKIRDHHRKRPVIMVFVAALLLLGLAAGTVAAARLLTEDKAVFKSTIDAGSPIKQHLLKVDGSGDLIAKLRDTSNDSQDKVRFTLTFLNDKGEQLQQVTAADPGARVQIVEQVVPGVYSFTVSTPDTLSDNGASYRLNLTYPSDTAEFTDTTSPTISVSSPMLGDDVSGTFTVAGEAADETALSQVSLRIDEGSWIAATGLESWAVEIDSAAYDNGQHIFEVRATDESGNETVETTLFNFNNVISDPDPDPNPDPDPDPDPNPDPDPDPTTGDAAFFENFTGNTGLENFRVGVYHRNIGQQVLGETAQVWGDNNAGHGGSWTGDHDLDCSPPELQRSLESTKTPDNGANGWVPFVDFNLDEIVYMCKDHVMTSMGDADAYSIVWFSPDKTFKNTDVRTVSWDVNVTDLMARQWWEVSIVPKNTQFLATIDWLSGTAGIADYSNNAVVVGSGPFGGTSTITTNGQTQNDGICIYDQAACDSKRTRLPFSVTDNRNGTITVNYGGLFTRTVSGSLPNEFEVYFKDHNYTPDKDGQPAGYTWHWDNIRVE